MVRAWKPNLKGAGADLGFALAAFVVGLLGAPLFGAGLVFLGAVAAWAWTRRRPLAVMAPARRFMQGAIAVAMIAAVLALAYWIGLRLGGHS